MTQSPEYPDLPWVQPRSWTNANRTSVQLVVVHTTEGAASAAAAEDGAAYDQRRTDGTSTHYFHDSTSTIQCVHTADEAHAARNQGNKRGVHHELCTRAGSANWADAYHQAMLQRAAKQAARDAHKWKIPVRRLTAEQVADGVKGFCGHAEVTKAFPQDNGTHTDPGPGFPWPQFLDMVRTEMEGDMPLDSTDLSKIESVVTKVVDDRLDDLARAVWLYQLGNPERPDPANPGKYLTDTAGYFVRFGLDRTADVGKTVEAALAAAAAKLDVDEQALADAVVAKLPADGADITPADLQEAIIGALKALVEQPTA